MFDLQNHNITDKISSDRLDDIGLTLQLNPRRILDSTKTTQQTKKTTTHHNLVWSLFI